MSALIKDTTAAVKIARLSAVNARLNPKGRLLNTVTAPSLNIEGIKRKENTADKRIAAKENQFLREAETRLIKGRINTPVSGMRIIRNKVNSLVIIGYLGLQGYGFPGEIKIARERISLASSLPKVIYPQIV